jgi:hypothetical protein
MLHVCHFIITSFCRMPYAGVGTSAQASQGVPVPFYVRLLAEEQHHIKKVRINNARRQKLIKRLDEILQFNPGAGTGYAL